MKCSKVTHTRADFPRKRLGSTSLLTFSTGALLFYLPIGDQAQQWCL
jgi:hypothetical protein